MTVSELKPLASAVRAISVSLVNKRSGGVSGELKFGRWRSSVIGARMRTRYARWRPFTPAEDVSIAEIRVSVGQHAQCSHHARLLPGPDLGRSRRGDGRRHRARTALAGGARATRGRQ